MEKLRFVLTFYNMRKVADLADISYDILKNFSCGRKKYLTDAEYNAVTEAIQTIAGGIR